MYVSVKFGFGEFKKNFFYLQKKYKNRNLLWVRI